MNVEELIKHLQTGDQKAEVVVTDHFGKPIKLNEYDFCFVDYKRGESPQGLMGWYLKVSAIDIGPEPE